MTAAALPRLAAAFAKYRAIARATYRTHTTYLASILSRTFFVVMLAWIFTQLYTATYGATGATDIEGFTVPMVVWLLTLVQTLRQTTMPYLSNEIEAEVRSGEFAYAASRPYSYLLFHTAKAWGRKLANLGPNMAIAAAAAFILVGPIGVNGTGIGAALVLFVLGFTIAILFQLIFGMITFWMEDISPLRWIHGKAQMIFGGNIIPLVLFPQWLRTVAEFLPWSQIFYAPAYMIVRFDPALFWQFLLTQIGWIVVFSIILAVLFRRGIKHVATNGG